MVSWKSGDERKGSKKDHNQTGTHGFFLPLGMAVIHIAVAFPQLCKMMTVFSMTNSGLFAVFTILSVLLFGLAYLLVYRLTARTYFKIVQS